MTRRTGEGGGPEQPKFPKYPGEGWFCTYAVAPNRGLEGADRRLESAHDKTAGQVGAGESLLFKLNAGACSEWKADVSV